MSIPEAKELVAKDKGYPSWEEMYNWISREGEKPCVVAQLIEAAVSEAYGLIQKFDYEQRMRAKSELFKNIDTSTLWDKE